MKIDDKGGNRGMREAITKLENDRAGREPSLDTWHAPRHSGRRSLFFLTKHWVGLGRKAATNEPWKWRAGYMQTVT